MRIATLLTAVLLMVGGCLTTSASAAVLISDTFTGSDGTAITSHTPDIGLPRVTAGNYVNAPGGYYSPGNAEYYDTYGSGGPGTDPATIQSNAMQVNTNSAILVSLQTGGSYTRPAAPIYTVSVDIHLNSPTIATHGLGAGVGFYNFDTTGTAPNIVLDYGAVGDNTGAGNVPNFGNEYFTGLVLGNDGSVSLLSSSLVVGSPIAYNSSDFGGSSFNVSNLYTLAYTVDTSTGAISDATLTGITTPGSEPLSFSTNLFSNANTYYAGIVVHAGAVGANASLDNWQVAEVTPEPASLALMGLGAVVLVRRRRAARRN